MRLRRTSICFSTLALWLAGSACAQGFEQVAPRLRVEADGRLVHQQDRRSMQAGPHEFHFSSIAAGEFAHFAVEVRAKAQALATGRDALERHVPRHALQVGLKQEVALDAQVEIERDLLEDHADVTQRHSRRMPQRMTGHFDFAAIGREQAREYLKECRLAGAIRPEQGDELAAPDLQR